MPHSNHVLIVEGRFYEDITDELVGGAIEALEEENITYERLAVPGAFEIPPAIRLAILGEAELLGRHFDGFLALGCVIRGETTHYDYVCQETARALMDMGSREGLAIGYGILTVENRVQAWERASMDRQNKGAAVARACLRMIEIRRHFGLQGS